jgi:hypothetical protein
MLSRLALIFMACFVLTAEAVQAGETRPALPATEVAVLCEAVVVAHVGSVSNAPAATGGSLAFWVDRTLKGRLNGGRDIIWIPRKELPKVQADGKLWLLFLSSLGDGSWHVAAGSEAETVESVTAPKLAEISKAIGSFAPKQDGEAPDDAELVSLVKKAARGSQEARRDAMQKLLAGGEGVKMYLSSMTTSDEHDVMTLARTLLPLFNGGPAVKELRLSLEPLTLAMTPGDLRNLTVNFANLSTSDMRIVTGQSAWGENVLAAGAYEIRQLSGEDGEKKAAAKGTVIAALPSIMPADYGKPRTEGGSPLPLIASAHAMSLMPLTVGIELEKFAADGKELRRVKFPHGHIVLPGPGKYALRVRFAGPGPRPDQQRLIDAHYWGGGQLVSNDIVLLVK